MLKNRYKPVYVDLLSGKWHTTNEVTDSNLKCLRVRVTRPALTWHVKHWRRTTKLYFQILDNSNSEVIPQAVTIIDNDTIQINFAEETSGTLNLIFKEGEFYDILPTPTVTPLITVTPTATVTLTPAITVTVTGGLTPTPTGTVTPTVTPTNTVTPTVTATVTPTVTVTDTPSVTVTPTLTVTPTVSGAAGPHASIIWEGDTIYGSDSNGGGGAAAAYVRLTDFHSLAAINAYVSVDDRDGTDAANTTVYDWADHIPVAAGDYWARVRVDASDHGYAPTILHNSINYNPDDEVQITHQFNVFQDGQRLEAWLENTSNVWWIDICKDDGGAPDGQWAERRVELTTTHSGAVTDFIWWHGGTLDVHHEDQNPEPRVEFFGDASGGDAGTSNYVYNTLSGDQFGPWWADAGPYTQGRFETWITWGLGTDDYLDVVIEDYQQNVIAFDTDFELIGANIYLDFTGDPVGTEKTADLYFILMDTTDAWREVSRHVVLYGKKLA